MLDLPTHPDPGSGQAAVGVRARKPDWLRVRPPGGTEYTFIKGLLRERGLHTVCEEARCPNVAECWSGGTATFMLLGDICTRGCRFCAVTTGNPGGLVDPVEPNKLADAVALMALRYVVLTMVDRDDLADGGAAHVGRAVRAIKARVPHTIVEALVGDFSGEGDPIDAVCASGVEVFAHNIETVERLQRTARDQRCGYQQSLDVLEHAKRHVSLPYTKSSLMLGLGEQDDEVVRTMRDLRDVGVDFLTLGQYLQPTPRHLAVEQYVTPERFDALRRVGEKLGFLYVAAGPLVRSSYKAAEFFIESLIRDSNSDLTAGIQSARA